MASEEWDRKRNWALIIGSKGKRLEVAHSYAKSSSGKIYHSLCDRGIFYLSSKLEGVDLDYPHKCSVCKWHVANKIRKILVPETINHIQVIVDEWSETMGGIQAWDAIIKRNESQKKTAKK